MMWEYNNVWKYWRHCIDGKRHREDGPAMIWDHKIQGWFQNDRMHRLDGANLMPDPEYIVWGVEIT